MRAGVDIDVMRERVCEGVANCTASLFCAFWDPNTNNFEPLVEECTATYLPASQTVRCECLAAPVAASRRRHRRLVNDTANFADGEETETISLDFTSMLVSSSTVVDDTFRGGFSIGDASGVITIACLIFIWCAFVLVAVADFYDGRDRRRKNAIVGIRSTKHHRGAGGGLRRSKSARAARTEEEAVHDDLWFGLMLATPAELLTFTEIPVLKRAYLAVKRGHDFYEALSMHAGDAPSRLVRSLFLCSKVSTAMFTTSIVYQVLYPDDNSFCNDFSGDAAACLDERSLVNRREERCAYDGESDICYAREADNSVTAIVIATAFSIVLLAPLALFLDWLVFMYLSEPSTESRLSLELCDTQKQQKKKQQRTRARVLCEEEMAFLTGGGGEAAAGGAQGAAFKLYICCCAAGRWVAEAVLRRRVLANAMEAVHLESLIEDQERDLQARLRAGSLDGEEYVKIVRDRKIRVMKVAIRDTLPVLKSRIFQRYCRLIGGKERVTYFERRSAMALMALICALGPTYAVLFSQGLPDGTQAAWLASFILSEIQVALLILPLRLFVMALLLPSIIRSDVGIDKGIYGMPHYSAAGMLARKRDDLLPGLSAILDDRWRAGDAEGDAEGNAAAGAAAGAAAPAAGAEEGKMQVLQKQSSEPRILGGLAARALDDREARVNSAMEKMRDNKISLSELAAVLSLTKEAERASGGAALADGKRTFGAGERAGALHKLSTVREESLTGSGRSIAHVYGSSSLRSSAAASSVVEEMPAPEGDGGDCRCCGPLSCLRSLCRRLAGKGQLAAQNADRLMAFLQPAEDVEGELTRQPTILFCFGQLILMVLAVIILLPEPLQEAVLDEGLPVAVAFFVIADLGFRSGDEGLDVAFNLVLLLLLLTIPLGFVLLVDKTISLNIKRSTLTAAARQAEGKEPRASGSDGSDAAGERRVKATPKLVARKWRNRAKQTRVSPAPGRRAGGLKTDSIVL